MRSDEWSGGHFFYGPAVMVPHREPFAYERYLFGKYHDCGKYAELEKKFFSENEEIIREVFFDTNNLLGVDSDEDVEDVVSVKYDDFVPEMFSEEGQLMRERIKEILETKIVRLSPVNSESEDEETMERVASLMVVEAVGDSVGASVATCFIDSSEKVVTGGAKLLSDPGPFSEDVSMDDFAPRTRRGSVLFLSFCEPAGGEVSFLFSIFLI
jgi:hypothetical protein